MRVQSPGFFDLQLNGYGGVDFNDPAVTPEDVSRALDALQDTGVTRCLPTIITSSFEGFAPCARAVVASGHPAVAGIHMEGPYISPEDGPRGAHPREWTREASVDDFERRQDAAGGRIRLVTLAPEVPGALALVEHLVDRGVRVAIGHSGASKDAITDGGVRRSHDVHPPGERVLRHPPPPPERHLDPAGRGPPGGRPHRRRDPPPAGDGEVDGPGQDPRPLHPGDRRGDLRGLPPGALPARPPRGRAEPRGPGVVPDLGNPRRVRAPPARTASPTCAASPGWRSRKPSPWRPPGPAAYLDEEPRGSLDLDWDPDAGNAPGRGGAGVKPVIIGVAGGTGSGKTRLVREIVRRLGPDIAVVQHDSYYRDRSGDVARGAGPGQLRPPRRPGDAPPRGARRDPPRGSARSRSRSTTSRPTPAPPGWSLSSPEVGGAGRGHPGPRRARAAER